MPSCSVGLKGPHCPTVPPAIAFAVLYSLTTIAHIYQGNQYKKPFTCVLIMGGIWEVIGMITRAISLNNWTTPIISTSFMFILLAPLWINAFVYMTLGRLVNMYMSDKTLVKISGRRLGMVFVLLDITCFFIQLGGGLMTTGDNDIDTVKLGLKIYTAGTSLQEVVIAGFLATSIVFRRRLKQENLEWDVRPAQRLLMILHIVLGLIVFRVAFRILEFSAPFGSKVYETIHGHDYFLYIFDSVPMLLALIVFNLSHPGKVLQGPDSGSGGRQLRLRFLKSGPKNKSNGLVEAQGDSVIMADLGKKNYGRMSETNLPATGEIRC